MRIPPETTHAERVSGVRAATRQIPLSNLSDTHERLTLLAQKRSENVFMESFLNVPSILGGLFPHNHQDIFTEHLIYDPTTFALHPQFLQPILNFIYPLLFYAFYGTLLYMLITYTL